MEALVLLAGLILLGLPIVGFILGLAHAGRLRRLEESLAKLTRDVERLQRAPRSEVAAKRPEAAERPAFPDRPPVIEREAPAASAPVASAPEPAAATAPEPAPAPPPLPEPRPIATPRPKAPASPAAPKPPREAFDLERFFGVKFFSWMAGIALVIAGGFFLHYSIAQGWLKPPVQMALGLLVGVGLVIGCELKVARAYTITANALLGAGLSILLATFWAGHVRWHLVPLVITFLAMTLVTAAAVWLSVRRDSPFVAVLALVGGFATPFALRSGHANALAFFGYLLLLSSALALIAMRMRWHFLLALSLAATTLNEWGWVLGEMDPGNRTMTMAGFAAFPLANAAVWWLARRKKDEGEESFRTIAALAATLPLAFTTFVLATPQPADRPWLPLGFLLLVVAGLGALAIAMSLPELAVIAGIGSFSGWLAWIARWPDADTWWPALGFVLAPFVFLHAFLPVIAKWLGRPHGKAMTVGALAAPALVLMTLRFIDAAPVSSLVAPLLLLLIIVAAGLILEDGRVVAVAGGVVIASQATWAAAEGADFGSALSVAAGVALALILLLAAWANEVRTGASWRWPHGDVVAGAALVPVAIVVAVAGNAEEAWSTWLACPLGVAVAAALRALDRRRAGALGVTLGAAALVVTAGVFTRPSEPAPLVACLALLACAVLGVATWRLHLSGRRRGGDAARPAFAAIAMAVLLAAITGMAFHAEPVTTIPASALTAILLACVALAAHIGLDVQPASPVVVAVVAFLPAWMWGIAHADAGDAAPALIAMPLVLHAGFLAWTMLAGARVGSRLELHVAAALSSLPAFLLARWGFIEQGWRDALGLLAVAQVLALLGLLAHLVILEKRIGVIDSRRAIVAGAALAYLTAAIPLQFDREWITIGFALEAVALAWLFLARIRHPGLALWSLGLCAAVFVRLALNPAVLDYHPRAAHPVVNWFLYAYGTCAVALMVVASLLKRADDGTSESIPRARAALYAGAGVLLFLLLNIEIADFWSKGETLTFRFSAGLAPDLTYTLGWAVFAIALLIVGIAQHVRAARIASIGLLLVVVLKCFLHDLMRLGGLYRVGAFLGLAISLALVAVLFQRFVLRARPEEISS